MKIITAIVRPFTLERIVVALEDIENFPGISITDVEGFGKRSPLRAVGDINPFQARKKLMIILPDEMTEQVVSAIRQHAHTGKKGDGLISVSPVDEVISI